MKRILEDIFDESINKLTKEKSKIDDNKINSITINTNFFNQNYCNEIDITTCNIVNIGHLKEIKTPVLYWFELTNNINHNEEIRKAYEMYRNSIKTRFKDLNYRNTASYKKNYSKDKNTLYVGKVEKNFWGRVVTHLGYAQSKKTAGMQLFHWYNPTDFGQLKLNYCVFSNDMKYLITVLEKRVSQEKEPLIGRY